MPFDGLNFPQSRPAPGRAFARAGEAARDLMQRGFRGVAALAKPASVKFQEISPAHLLGTARSLIRDEGKWIRGQFHRPNRRYCAVGALRAAARQLHAGESLPVALGLLRQIAKMRGFDTIERMNDSSSHAEVLTSFDLAINVAEAMQAA